MARVYVFADESGDFNFSRHPAASKYFILTTVTSPDCDVGNRLQELRRDLAWRGMGLDSEFHATTDKQAVRDEVFKVLSQCTLRIDSTILEKAKAQPSIRPTDHRFYQYAWYLHMKYVMPCIATSADELLVVSASLGTKKLKLSFLSAVQDVIAQFAPTVGYQVATWSCVSEPCLQAADYCAWAIQRKWESGDDRSYRLIRAQCATEFPPFRYGSVTYY